LQTGAHAARVVRPLVDPFRLTIPGFFLDTGTILLHQDIRELHKGQFIIDDVDVLSEPEDLLRLKKIIELNYQLIGKRVRTQSKKAVGKVEDYVFDDMTHEIKKIYVKRSVLHSFHESTLVVDRSQVIEVDDTEVIIADALIKSAQFAPQRAR